MDKILQYRHGDLLVEGVSAIPSDARAADRPVLAEGETTGHAHRLNGAGAVVLESEGETYISAPQGATITHEEHRTITLPPGEYRVIRQIEYDPYAHAARRVAD